MVLQPGPSACSGMASTAEVRGSTADANTLIQSIFARQEPRRPQVPFGALRVILVSRALPAAVSDLFEQVDEAVDALGAGRHQPQSLEQGLGRVFEPGENLRRLRTALVRDQSGDGRRDLCAAANGRLDRVSKVLIAIADQAQIDERQAAREDFAGDAVIEDRQTLAANLRCRRSANRGS